MIPLEPSELKEKYFGVQVVMVTPFQEDYSLDEEGLRSNTKFLIENSVHILHPTGSTGEFWNLTPEEHKRVIEIVVDEAKGRIPVVPGTAHSGTKLTVEMSRYAEEAGADGVLIVPPYYVIPTPEGVYQHFRTVAEAINIGVIVYNNPGMCKITIGPDLMARLAEIPNVVAVKDTTKDMILKYRFIRLLGDKLAFTVGIGEPLAPYFYLSGGRGHISDLANFAPEFSLEMYNGAMKENWRKVKEIHFKLGPYFELVERLTEKNKGMIWISVIKEAMKILGLPGWPPRKPLIPLTEDERGELKGALKDIGKLK